MYLTQDSRSVLLGRSYFHSVRAQYLRPWWLLCTGQLGPNNDREYGVFKTDTCTQTHTHTIVRCPWHDDFALPTVMRRRSRSRQKLDAVCATLFSRLRSILLLYAFFLQLVPGFLLWYGKNMYAYRTAREIACIYNTYLYCCAAVKNCSMVFMFSRYSCNAVR